MNDLTTREVGATSSTPPLPLGGGSTATVTVQPVTPDADLVAETVLGCRDVVRLSGGQFGEVATYLPGRRVTGVRVTTDRVSVHVVARYGPPLHELSARIHRALQFVVPLPVEVVVDDVERV